MTNLERLFQDVDRLAGLLVSEEVEREYDEGYDGEWYECGETTYYRTTDGHTYYGYEDAVEHQKKWLLSEEGITDDSDY